MDYKTKAISRDTIRTIAYIIRTQIFKCKNKFYFDVIEAFEQLPYLFDNVTTEIVFDDDPDLNGAPGTIIPDMKGNYHIKIKQSVYDGAYHDKTGGYRNHIMHEISHYILFELGYLPQFNRVYKNNELKCYESVEWQAKALAGEILIPYETTIGMSERNIIKKCKVSEEAARKRISLDK